MQQLLPPPSPSQSGGRWRLRRWASRRLRTRFVGGVFACEGGRGNCRGVWMDGTEKGFECWREVGQRGSPSKPQPHHTTTGVMTCDTWFCCGRVLFLNASSAPNVNGRTTSDGLCVCDDERLCVTLCCPRSCSRCPHKKVVFQNRKNKRKPPSARGCSKPQRQQQRQARGTMAMMMMMRVLLHDPPISSFAHKSIRVPHNAPSVWGQSPRISQPIKARRYSCFNFADSPRPPPSLLPPTKPVPCSSCPRAAASPDAAAAASFDGKLFAADTDPH